jgi:hypothetical protein
MSIATRFNQDETGLVRLCRARLLLVFFVVALLLAGVLFQISPWNRPDQEATRQGDQDAEALTMALSPCLPISLSASAGQRRVYRLECTNKSLANFQELSAGLNAGGAAKQNEPAGGRFLITTHVKGELIATVVESNAREVVIAYHVRQAVVHFAVNGQPKLAESQAMQADLGRDTLAVLNRQGRLLALHFDPQTSAEGCSLMRSLLAQVQFVLPAGPGSSVPQAWDVEEEEPNGRYVARYQAEPAGAGVKNFRKTRLRYLPSPRSIQAGLTGMTQTVKPAGDQLACFDAHDGSLVSLTGRETTALVIAGKTVLDSEVTVRLECRTREALALAELASLQEASTARLRSTTAVSMKTDVFGGKDQRAAHEARLGKDTLESLVAELHKAEASAAKGYDDTELYAKFRAITSLQPNTSGALGKLLTAADSNSLTMRLLAGVLGSVGHPEAQKALASAIRARSGDAAALLVLIPALGAVSQPTPFAEDTLFELASTSREWNIASTAQLALGIMARNLAATSPQRSARIVSWAVEKLQAATEPGLTEQWLLVLGNAGAAKSVPVITPFLNAPEAQVRRLAVFALRWVDSAEAQALVVKTLLCDEDAEVRVQAATALSYQTLRPVAMEGQIQAFISDDSVQVRLAVLSNLAKVQAEIPDIRALLEGASQQDVSDEVRKAAGSLLVRVPNS